MKEGEGERVWERRKMRESGGREGEEKRANFLTLGPLSRPWRNISRILEAKLCLRTIQE